MPLNSMYFCMYSICDAVHIRCIVIIEVCYITINQAFEHEFAVFIFNCDNAYRQDQINGNVTFKIVNLGNSDHNCIGTQRMHHDR